jgi:DNA-binding transcriptional MocR family regulator
MHMQAHFAARMNRVKPSAIRELLALGADPEVVSFGGGNPDPLLFPSVELADCYARALAERSTQSLQYAESNGFPTLRDQVAQRVARDGIEGDRDNVLILHGAQQGLDLVAKMLIQPGDVIAAEDPTFVGALIAFNPYEPEYLAVPMDDEGMVVAALEAELTAGRQVKLVYTVPDFQNPTGVTMSLERRRQLVELARRFDFVILEDSPYREIRFVGEQLPTIKSLDTDGRVLHLTSFSKILAPGVRLGAMVASKPAITALSMYLETYDIDAHIAVLRAAYHRKRDLALSVIAREFPSSVSATRPEGGLFTWLTFPPGFDTAIFMAERMLPEIKVAFVPGFTFFPVVGQPNHARLNYSGVADELMERGLTALGRLVHDELERA